MKRSAIILLLLIVLISPALFSAGSGEKAPSVSSDKPYAGTTIRAVFPVHPWTDGVKKHLAEFTEETGIDVTIDELGTDAMSNKIAVELRSRSSSMDVFYVRPLNETKLFGLNKWAEDLNTYLADDAEYELGDFVDATIQSLTYDGRLIGIPTTTERHILYYRTDVFEENGLEPPKTLDQLMEYAKLLNDPGNGFYGIVARGKTNILITQFSSYLHSFGGSFNEGNTALMDSPEAIKAMSFYTTMLKNYGPPGIVNFSWPEAAALMAQGKVAMFTDADAIYLNVVSPDKSSVGDKIGYAVFPAGPAGAKPYNVCSGAVAVSTYSKQKAAAVEFVKWMTSKEMVMQLQVEGNSGARISVWDNPESTKNWPAELVKVINASNQIGMGWDRPRVINVNQARDILSVPLMVGFEGGDITAAAKKANAELQALIDEEK